MTNILITGVAGFIGSHLKQRLDETYNVCGIDLLEKKNIAALKRSAKLQNITQDSIHSNFIDVLEKKPDVVIHLAAETGVSASLTNPEKYFHANVQGTFNVLEQCRKNGVKYLIYASSSSVYEPNQSLMNEASPHENQLSFYGTSKRMTEVMIENYCKQFGLVAIGLRFFTVYGSWTRPDMAAYKFMKLISEGLPITIYDNGNVFRDFTHVSDIVHAITLLMEKIQCEKMGIHRIFNIGYGAPTSVKKYAELLAQNLGKEIVIETAKLPANELVATHSDTRKLEEYISFKPQCSVERGIVEMTDWFKDFRYE